MSSRADRPYGRFPLGDEPDPVAPPPASRARRWYEPAPGRHAQGIRHRVFFVSVVLLALALVASAQQPPRVAEAEPSPPPLPAIADVYQRVSLAVVEVRGSGAAEADRRLGAGVVVDDSGAILTSLHVVRDAQITVRYIDGTEARAVIVAELPERDIAVISTGFLPAGLPPAVLGDPNRLRVGEEALAIGNPFGLTRSLSVGVVSGVGRTAEIPAVGKPVGGLIQFDGAVNPGNSGGPLVDRRGEVVGIVVGILSPSDGSFAQGVGFAVTIDVAGGALGVPPD